MPHLEAVLAPWRHSLGSARWTFGDTLGDATADAIWALAQPAQGVTRTEVRDLFSRFAARRKTAVLFPDRLCVRGRRGPAMTGANGPVVAFSGA